MKLKKETGNIAHKIACERFYNSNPGEICKNANVKYNIADQKLVIKFLNRDLIISYPDAKIYYEDNNKEPDRDIQILVLHYLTGSKNSPLTGNLISYRGLPGGNIYYNAFYRNAIRPIALKFGSDPILFKESAIRLGGHEIEYGDLAFFIPALPRIHLVYILWLADDELPGSSTILYDSSASLHLPTEDLAVLGELTTIHFCNKNY